jgi:hypothetical protein
LEGDKHVTPRRHGRPLQGERRTHAAFTGLHPGGAPGFVDAAIWSRYHQMRPALVAVFCVAVCAAQAHPEVGSCPVVSWSAKVRGPDPGPVSDPDPVTPMTPSSSRARVLAVVSVAVPAVQVRGGHRGLHCNGSSHGVPVWQSLRCSCPCMLVLEQRTDFASPRHLFDWDKLDNLPRYLVFWPGPPATPPVMSHSLTPLFPPPARAPHSAQRCKWPGWIGPMGTKAHRRAWCRAWLHPAVCQPPLGPSKT